MSINNSLKTKLIAFTLGILTSSIELLPTAGLAAPCKINQSIYRDADGKGFELVFGAPIPGTGSSHATATIRHPKQGNLYNFNVTQASGYGSISLLAITSTEKSLKYSDRLGINFFDPGFRSATPLVLGQEAQAPEYAFIYGIGSYDYYKRRGSVSEKTAPFLGDVMWIHNRCQ
jgi:hypothetical protein